MKLYIKELPITLLLILIITACDAVNNTTAQPTVEPSFSGGAQSQTTDTRIVVMTSTVEATVFSTAIMTSTPEPIATVGDTVAITNTPEATAVIATNTAMPEIWYVNSCVGVRIRTCGEVSNQCSIITTLPHRSELMVLNRGEWHEVLLNDGSTGYVSSNFTSQFIPPICAPLPTNIPIPSITPIPPTQTNTPIPSVTPIPPTPAIDFPIPVFTQEPPPVPPGGGLPSAPDSEPAAP